MRDCRLGCVQAVIERQKRMPAEANDDRLFLDRQHRRSRFLWSRPSVHDRAARLPLAHRLLIDAVTSGERSQALFTMLYRSTDRLSRRGAPMKNLAHSASFDCTIKVRDQTPRLKLASLSTMDLFRKCGEAIVSACGAFFELCRAEEVKRRVSPGRIVEPVDIAGNGV